MYVGIGLKQHEGDNMGKGEAGKKRKGVGFRGEWESERGGGRGGVKREHSVAL